MKKTIIILSVLSIIFAGCQDHLDKKPLGLPTTESFLGNPETAEENFEQLIRAAYSAFYVNEASWRNNTHHGEWFFGDWLSDDCEKGGDGSGDFPEVLGWRTWTCPSSGHHNNAWLAGYLGAGRANAVLDALETYGENLSEASYNRIKGEALFVRAYHYFYLAKVYASVPYFDHPVLPEEFRNQPKLSPEELYAEIEADLTEAIDLVPEKSNWGDVYPGGRATKGAVRSILARVITMEIGFGFNGKTWQDVYDQTLAIINSGEYALVPNYAVIFEEEGEQSSESVFEIECADINQQPYGAPGGNIQNRMVTPRPISENSGKRLATGGWGFSCPSEDLYNEFEPGDVRRECTIIENGSILWEDGDPSTDEQIVLFESDQIPTGYFFRKYSTPPELTPSNNVNGPSNMRKVRYAEVLLTHAEAAYHIGEESEAFEYVNMVRERAINSTPPVGSVLGNPGYPPAPQTLAELPGSLSGQDLLDAIKHERRVELAIEGNRVWDLIRWGEYEDAIRTYIPEDHFLSSNDPEVVIENYRGHMIDGVPSFPIPRNEVEQFGIEQNPGY